MLAMSILACESALGMASEGAVVNFDGAWAASPQPRIRAKGVREWDSKNASDTMRRAEAPSERGDALGAVTVPVPSVMNAGLIDLSFSTLRGVWGFSSRETTFFPARVVMVTGAISGAKSPVLEAC